MTLLGLDEAFFRDYWRRRPVVLRGAAQGLLAEAPSSAELVELRARPELDCSTDDETVWFYQQFTDELPLAKRLVDAARALFEWEDIACDFVHTQGPASIGCHYDEGDNFSIQLVGTKRWRLSPPDTLPPDLLRRRMLKEPDIGFAELGPAVTEFLVEPGDALYIPQTWIHWGESHGDSVSASLVFNQHTFHRDFAESVTDALRRAPGWAKSLPVGPGSTAERVRALDALTTQTFSAVALERVRPHVIGRSPALSLRMDMARVKSFVATAPVVPTAGFVLPDEGVDSNRVLRALLARRTLRRLLMVVAKRHASTRSATDRILYQQCVDALLARSDSELERLCTEPELVSIATIVQDGESRHEDPIAAELARALVPELKAIATDSVPFSLLPDLDGGFTVRRAGVRIVAEHPHEELVARMAGGAWQVFCDGRFRAPDDAPGLRVEPLARLLGEGPHLSAAPTTWVARNIRDRPVSAADSAAFATFGEAMRSGAELLASTWPAAWREVADGLRWLLPLPPLPDRGLEPFNYSVHALRGLVMTSPRRDHRCAQTLVHEAGHNRLSTILDLLPLCTNPGDVVTSPVVNDSRPMSFVFHGCFAFAQDVALTERLLPRAPATQRDSMSRYLEDVRCKAGAALDVLEREARLTDVGAIVRDEIATVVRS